MAPSGARQRSWDADIEKIQSEYLPHLTCLTEYELASGHRKEQLDKAYGPSAAIEITKFHLDFDDFPVGMPDDLKKVYLEAFKAGYIIARTQPWLKAKWMRDDYIPMARMKYYGNQGSQEHVQEVLRRTHGYPWHLAPPSDEAVIDWREQCDDDQFKKSMGYGTQQISNFSNFPGRKDVLTWGTTHVAVGFNDLIVLLKSRLVADGSSPEHIDATTSKTSLKFIGIDSSAYSIAKTKVVWQMMMDSSIPICSIIEVWFSATWGRSSLEAFGKALNHVVSEMKIKSRPLQSPCSYPILEGRGITVRGLQSEKGQKLNGQRGIARSCAEGRWDVYGDGWQAKVKAENLEPLEMTVAVGSSVEIHGLVKLPELNGHVGTAVRLDAASGRWMVLVDSREQPVLIREANLSWTGMAQESAHPYLQEVRPVADYLLYWLRCFEEKRHHTVEEARRFWWKAQISELPERETHIAGCLCRKKDQRATLKYLCSGDVFLDQTAAAGDVCSDCTPYVGSLCMWSLPEASPSLEKGLALGCITTEDYCRTLLGEAGEAVEPDFSVQALESSPNKEFDVMQCFTWYIAKRIQHTVRRSGSTWTGDFICQRVCWENRALLDRIWKEAPFTMSWDNILDYMKPTTFHSIARLCSRAGDTVHYAYSMNYPCETRGANIMDWDMQADPNDRQSRVYWVDRSMERSIRGGCQHSMERLCRIWDFACDALYTKPYRCDPENLINYTLIASLGLDEKWVNHFMNKGKISPKDVPRHPECTKNNVGLAVFSSLMGLESPFQRSSTCVTFAWTYDPMIRGVDFATGKECQ
ncbi:purD [Symbiodinium natans]|uniref:PurD protein n=1 Tax=Symbiodinium natans TaxID=878477 RepID=A0A812KUW3_9DINO|nr:purD [Symbiodinium natans]